MFLGSFRLVASSAVFAIDIFQLCLENDVQIDARWIPHEAYIRADLLSRYVDKDDWSLSRQGRLVLKHRSFRSIR